MSPEIFPGDHIFAHKWLYGARIFDVFDAVAGKDVHIRRMPGLRSIRRNDVLVFHYPYPAGRERIAMDMRSYYIKRCIGLPGDCIEIRQGCYRVNGDSTQYYGNVEQQRALSHMVYPQPSDPLLLGNTTLGWTMLEFGPLKIPRKGETVTMDRQAVLLYQRLIEWEKAQLLTFANDTLWENGLPIINYTFTHNYYFMAGDKIVNSQDSRYWGLLPEEFIVGKAWMVWKSEDAKHKIRWKRVFKKIR